MTREITERVTRKCCQRQDMRPLCMGDVSNPELFFCVHCGTRWRRCPPSGDRERYELWVGDRWNWRRRIARLEADKAQPETPQPKPACIGDACGEFINCPPYATRCLAMEDSRHVHPRTVKGDYCISPNGPQPKGDES